MYKYRVERLFNEASDRFEKMRRNPVTGTGFVAGLDPIKPQKEAACRALEARDWFTSTGPQDAPLLPLSYAEREDLKFGSPFEVRGLWRLVAWFARSLHAQNYDYVLHPCFDDYAKGVMGSPHAPAFITQDQSLRDRFPPCPLEGLGSGLYWDPPEPPKRRRRAG